jgi:hypothetical protein
MKYNKNSFRQSFSISFRLIIVSSLLTKFKNLVASAKFLDEFFLEFVEFVFDVHSFVYFHVHVEYVLFVSFHAFFDVFVELDLLASSFFDSLNASYLCSTLSNSIYSNFQWSSVSQSHSCNNRFEIIHRHLHRQRSEWIWLTKSRWLQKIKNERKSKWIF